MCPMVNEWVTEWHTNTTDNPGFKSKSQASWLHIKKQAYKFLGFLSEKYFRLSVIFNSSLDHYEEPFHASLGTECHPLNPMS